MAEYRELSNPVSRPGKVRDEDEVDPDNRSLIVATFQNGLQRVVLEWLRENRGAVHRLQVGYGRYWSALTVIGSAQFFWYALTLAIFLLTAITGQSATNFWTTKVNYNTVWLTTAGPDDDDNWVAQMPDGTERTGDNMYISWYFFVPAAAEILMVILYVLAVSFRLMGDKVHLKDFYANFIGVSDSSPVVHFRQAVYLAMGHALFISLCGQRDWTAVLAVGGLALIGGFCGVAHEVINANPARYTVRDVFGKTQNLETASNGVRWKPQNYSAIVARFACDIMLLFIQSWWMWKYPADSRMAYLYIIYFAGFGVHLLMLIAQLSNTAHKDIRFLVWMDKEVPTSKVEVTDKRGREVTVSLIPKDTEIEAAKAYIRARWDYGSMSERFGVADLNKADLTATVVDDTIAYTAHVLYIFANYTNVFTQAMYDSLAQALLIAFWCLVFWPIFGQTNGWEYAPKWWGY